MHNPNQIKITKASGEVVNFDESKLRQSLERANASKDVIDQISEEINSLLYGGITTKEIFKKAFSLLRKRERPSAARYKLKNAIMELGPTGFPFEKFVGKILEHEGYKTQVGVIVQGNCVQHEVDVIAQKGNSHLMIECKYHSDQGRFCNVKIPLYIHSRFLDVERKWKQQKGHETKLHQGGLYTNTRFTTDALQYGKCVGLLLTSWDYPRGNGLKDRIDKAGLHPLTALTTLTKAEKIKLLEMGVVLCKELYNKPELLKQVGIDKKRHKKILKESEEVCKIIQ